GASVIASSNVPVIAASYTVTGVDTVPYFFSTSPLASGVGLGIVNGLKSIFGGSLSGKKIAFEGLISPAVDGNLAAVKSQVEAAANPSDTAQSDFGKMYAAAYAIKAAYLKCGFPCSTAKFTSSLKAAGKIDIPNNALSGPLDFSKQNAGLTSAQVYQWDAANS